jgi:hypothetical protein
LNQRVYKSNPLVWFLGFDKKYIYYLKGINNALNCVELLDTLSGLDGMLLKTHASRIRATPFSLDTRNARVYINQV